MASMSKVHSPLKWIGGKSACAERIVHAFPDPSSYDLYVEPCGGAAHILFARPLSCGHQEVYNDLDTNLVTFWREAQCNADAMQSYLDSLLYSRQLYYEFYRSLFDGTCLSSFERATRWFYVLRSTGTGWLRRSPVGWDHRPSNASAYFNVLETFQVVSQRLRKVVIDNRDVLATLKRYDSPRTLFYLDPPYIGMEQYYETSKKGFPHQELAEALGQVQGFVALSYYQHASLDQWYPASTWHRLSWQQHKSSQIQLPDRDDMGEELLLMNYQPSHGKVYQEQELWHSGESRGGEK